MICLSSAGSLTSLHGKMENQGTNRTANESLAQLAPVGTALTPMTRVVKPVAHWPNRAHSSAVRTRPASGARSFSRRRHRNGGSGHDPDARGAHPRGLVVPLEEVCFQPEAGSARCVQRFDDSLNSAIHIKYRISLRSSSFSEPRYPLTRVV